jgi:hypothetical protein
MSPKKLVGLKLVGLKLAGLVLEEAEHPLKKAPSVV